MEKKLPKGAYGGVNGKDYVPYITKDSKSGGNGAVFLIGLILAIVFAASTAYSGMKAGLTVAAGIPGSIIGSAFVTAVAKQKGILGKNLVQGMASGGESIASGIIFVLPAIILIGSHVTFLEGFVVGVGGVLFGIGASTLVYNYLMVEEHGKLIYPEAMAISETLVAGEAGGDSMKYMGMGFGIGGIITALTSAVFNWTNNVISLLGSPFYKWKFELEVNPLLMGIGFIVGMETSLMMFAGSLLSNFAIIPLIGYFSDMAGNNVGVWNEPAYLINQMGANEIAGSYAKYIGAGMMLCGGIIGAIRLIPTIITSIKETLNARNNTNAMEGENSPLGMLLLLGGTVLGFIVAFFISGSIGMALIGAILTLILSLLFVIVAGRLTGTVGTSNLPVSGMTIAALVIITLTFVIMGWTSLADNKSLLLFGTFIVVAISTAGGYSQSQKVTYIMGGSKNEMQRYFTMAAVVGVIVVVGTILILSDQLQIIENPPFALPQANLMSTLTSGIMQGDLPWVMIIVGIMMALVFFFLNLPIMTIAVGFYLPIATTTIILVGAIIRLFVEKMAKSEADKEERVANGISLSSGLVAGGSIIGLLGIILQVIGLIGGHVPTGFAAGNGMAWILLGILVILTTLPLMKSTKS